MNDIMGVDELIKYSSAVEACYKQFAPFWPWQWKAFLLGFSWPSPGVTSSVCGAWPASDWASGWTWRWPRVLQPLHTHRPKTDRHDKSDRLKVRTEGERERERKRQPREGEGNHMSLQLCSETFFWTLKSEVETHLFSYDPMLLKLRGQKKGITRSWDRTTRLNYWRLFSKKYCFEIFAR